VCDHQKLRRETTGDVSVWKRRSFRQPGQARTEIGLLIRPKSRCPSPDSRTLSWPAGATRGHMCSCTAGWPAHSSIDAVRTCCSPRGASTSRTCRGAHVLPLLQACRTGSRCRPCKTKSNIFPTHVPKRGRKLVCCCPGRSQGQNSLSVRHGSRIAPGIVFVGSHSWLRDDSRASSLSGDLRRTELDVSGRPPIVRLTQHRAALMCTPSRLDPAARY
jgi:hypothetical protein